MTYAIDPNPRWTPDPSTLGETRMAQFMQSTDHAGYADLRRWSIDQPETFWSKIWDFCGVVGAKGQRILLDGDKKPGAHWFPGAKLNYAENLLQNRDDGLALVFWGVDKVRRQLSHAELYVEVARFQQFLIASGVGKGDRVAAYLPNLQEALIAMLATTALGAIWSSASPDFGVRACSTALAKASRRC